MGKIEWTDDGGVCWKKSRLPQQETSYQDVAKEDGGGRPARGRKEESVQKTRKGFAGRIFLAEFMGAKTRPTKGARAYGKEGSAIPTISRWSRKKNFPSSERTRD